MPLPHIAVIVPTLNREERLVDTITSILAADYPSELCEVLIVDQSNSHKEPVAAFLEKHAKTKKIHWFKPPEVSFQSLTKARNFGMAHAEKAEIYIFVDDDVEFAPDFLQRHVEAYQNKNIGAVAGRITVPGHTYPQENPVTIAGVTWFGGFINNFYGTEEKECDGFVGCNFSIRASVLKKVRGFDEAFIGNAMREDTDMATRIRRAGYTILFRPTAFVIHHMENTGGTRNDTSRISWYRAFFYNNFLFYGKNAPAWKIPFYSVHLARPILACWLYYGKGSPKALGAAFQGIRDGYRAARTSKYQTV